MARVLLTGARGFIGAAVLRRLTTWGHEVIALTSAPDVPGASWQHLNLLGAGESEIARLVEEIGVSHCIHAAWYTDHADYLTAEINRDWVRASLRLEAGFRAGGGRRFLGLGTCLEYDQHADCGHFSESRTPLKPETLYARCKTELLERISASESDFAWARVFYVYGPGDRAGRLVPFIVETLKRGGKVGPRFGGLRRDYAHVEDLASQLVRIALGEVRGAINTGTGVAPRLADIFALAGDLAGRPDLIELNDLTGDQAEVIEADMEYFRAEVGTLDARPLRQGLAEMFV
jgi:nucleoside-diphosphate-sugar epimerase